MNLEDILFFGVIALAAILGRILGAFLAKNKLQRIAGFAGAIAGSQVGSLCSLFFVVLVDPPGVMDPLLIAVQIIPMAFVVGCITESLFMVGGLVLKKSSFISNWESWLAVSILASASVGWLIYFWQHGHKDFRPDVAELVERNNEPAFSNLHANTVDLNAVAAESESAMFAVVRFSRQPMVMLHDELSAAKIKEEFSGGGRFVGERPVPPDSSRIVGTLLVFDATTVATLPIYRWEGPETTLFLCVGNDKDGLPVKFVAIEDSWEGLIDQIKQRLSGKKGP